MHHTNNLISNSKKFMMKKIYLLSVGFALSLGAAQAQQLTTCNFGEVEFVTDYGEFGFDSYSCAGVFNHVSANGQYAVGYDSQTVTSETGSSFLWRRSNPDQLEQISTSTDRVSATDVSNDGIIVGSFEKRSDIYTQDIAYPGFKHVDDAEWTKLPVPEDYSLYYAECMSFSSEARAITPDAQFIGGHVNIKVGEAEFQGTKFDKCHELPVIWKKTEEGYVIDQVFTDLGAPGKHQQLIDDELVTLDTEATYNTFFVRDISNDGRTLVGLNVSGRGGFNPAFIRDGVLVQLFECGEEDSPEEEVNFNGGYIQTIDANGNMYGYYADPNNIPYFFTFTADGKLVWNEDGTLCADKAGKTYPLYYEEMYPMWDCSEDGTVFVGAGTGDLGFGAYNYPMLAYDKSVSAISTMNKGSELSMSYKNNVLSIIGASVCGNVYDASGKLVRTIAQGGSLDMSAMPAGTYVVKVATATGIKTYKIAR